MQIVPVQSKEGVAGAEEALFVAQLVASKGHHEVVPGVVVRLTPDLQPTAVWCGIFVEGVANKSAIKNK